MQLSHVEREKARKVADVAVVPCWQGPKHAVLACATSEFSKWIAQPVRARDFLGKEGETLLLYRPGGKEKRILLLGLGKKSACEKEALRRAYGASVKVCKARRFHSVNFFVPSEEEEFTAIVEGTLIANYSFLMLKGKNEESGKPLTKLTFVGGDRSQGTALKRAGTLLSSVHVAQDLVNGNADEVTSESLIALARGIEHQWPSVKVTVLGKKELEEEEMGLMLAVNRGSMRDPALILLEYRGDPDSKDLTAIVGKGITYDTGGLNIKPTGSMETMKCDMAGAAASLAIARAVAQLKCKKNVLCVLAVAENAIGPHSYKPGDVIRSHAGKTVEIGNTDAEGRLVLADAFSYIQKHYKISRLIDMATLTGAIVVALGEEFTGMFSNNDVLAKALYAAGEAVHERVWRMPVNKEHAEMLKSQIADLKNCAGRKASSCTAAAFLEQFVHNIPWAHLDIAGTAYLSEARGYHATPATGVGVRLLVEFLENLHGK